MRAIAMNKKNSKLIEKKGITILKQLLLATGQIDPIVSEDDTVASWDGDLHYYGNPADFGTKNGIRKIPIQVKGTTNGRLVNGEFKKSVEVSDIHNYRNNHGCIYFQVYQPSQGLPEIFYKIFLPYDLELAVSKIKKPKQKTMTVSFKRFPKDSKAICAIMQFFFEHFEKQKGTAKFTFDPTNPTEQGKRVIADASQLGIPLFVTEIIGSESNPFEYAFDLPLYTYVNTSTGIQIPVGIDWLTSIDRSDEIKYIVKLDGVIHYTKGSFIQQKDKWTLSFGKGITIELSFSSNECLNININFSEKGTLFERIRDYTFWIGVNSQKKIEIYNDQTNPAIIDTGIIPDESEMKGWQKTLKLLEDIKKSLEFFGVKEDLKVDDLEQKELRLLNMLVRASRGKAVGLTLKGEDPIRHITIGNLTFVVVLQKTDKGMYIVHNFFKSLKKLVLSKEIEGVKYFASPCLILTKDRLVNNSDTDYEAIFDSIVKFPLVENYQSDVVEFLLKAISAFDETTSDESYKFIQKLSSWLFENDANNLNHLNLLQVSKRRRELIKAENDVLGEILDTEERTFYKIGACILLEDFELANKLLESLSKHDKEYIITNTTLPILKLWSKDKPDILGGADNV